MSLTLCSTLSPPRPSAPGRTGVKNSVLSTLRELGSEFTAILTSESTGDSDLFLYFNYTIVSTPFGPSAAPVGWTVETHDLEFPISLSSAAAAGTHTNTNNTSVSLSAPSASSSASESNSPSPSVISSPSPAAALPEPAAATVQAATEPEETLHNESHPRSQLTRARIGCAAFLFSCALALYILYPPTPTTALDPDERDQTPPLDLIVVLGAPVLPPLPSFPSLAEGFLDLPTAEVVEPWTTSHLPYINFRSVDASRVALTHDVDTKDDAPPHLPRVQPRGTTGREDASRPEATDVGKQDAAAVEWAASWVQRMAAPAFTAFAFIQQRLGSEFSNSGPLVPSPSAQAFPAQQKRVDELMPAWLEAAQKQREMMGGVTVGGSTGRSTRVLAGSSSANAARASSSDGETEPEERRFIGVAEKEEEKENVVEGKGKGKAP
ncbi:hypothetical protein B0H16DRAFT_1901056 [Mycena metata]|uniref:Uncharacterized protein n=1 Tax=Mycena metata TaxID=1033252 RepID=A0AAD7MB83_9AGAR|nr:hypothetical protein B0H16DRAFT_1901056 [Mycena metata]